MESFVYFATMIYRDEKPDFVKKTKQLCFKYLKEASYNTTDKNIVQTCNLIDDHNLEFVKSYLLKSAIDILSSQGYDTNLYSFYVSNLWAQELKPGASTNIHIHKNSQLSGWLFLETPENGSYPVFYDPRMNKEMIELNEYQPNVVTSATSIINFNNVEPGTVMFNNSWLKHQLSVNMSTQSTKALHFMISYDERKGISCNSH